MSGKAREGRQRQFHQAALGVPAAPRGVPARIHSLRQFGRRLGQRFQEGAGGEAEHAAVPVVAAVGHVAARGGQSGFSTKRRAFRPAAAVAGLRWPRRPAGSRSRSRVPSGGCRRSPASLRAPVPMPGLDVAVEAAQVADEVVGRQHQHHGVRAVLPAHVEGGQRDGGRRVAAHRLQQKTGRYAGRVGLAGEFVFVLAAEVVITVGHRQHLGDAQGRQRPRVGLLDQALAVGQLDEGFRAGLAADRPQAGAGATGQDDRDEVVHGVSVGHGKGVWGGDQTGAGRSLG
jgi:hypothetical protein